MPNLNRRDFLSAVGVSGTATLAGCAFDTFWDPKVPIENVLPYVVQPTQIVPGIAAWFATGCNECSAGCGVLARNREGRVVKLEGNPSHPNNKGKLCARGQAGLQATYSPDRFAGPMQAGRPTDWANAVDAVSKAITSARGANKSIAWIGRPKTGATAALVRQFVAAAGGEVAYWEPLQADDLRAAAKAVFGVDAEPQFVLDGAHTVLSFGADFLGTWGNPVHQTAGWANGRDPARGGFISRTVCVEPRVGTTSAMADVHLAAVPGTETGVAMALARLVADARGYSGPAAALVAGVNPDEAASAAGVRLERLTEIAGWMAANPSVVLPGGASTAAAGFDLAVATLILNEVAGNIGTSVVFGPGPNTAGQASYQRVQDLLGACKNGQVGVLFTDDLDLAYSLPADANVSGALAAVDQVVVFANEPNDTLGDKALVLPPGSTLETWGDTEAQKGQYTLQQPAMSPLHDTLPIGEVLLWVAAAAGIQPSAATTDAAAAVVVPAEGEATTPAVPAPDLSSANWGDYQKAWWKSVVWAGAAGSTGSFDAFWQGCLQAGGYFVDQPAQNVTFSLAAAPSTAAATPEGEGHVLVLFPHPFLADGRNANKPWAQEVPEPLTSYTWGTWAEIHPKKAAEMGLTSDDTVKLVTPAGSIEVGWFGSPSIREDTVAVVMGNGHSASGRYTRFGKNPMTLLASMADAGSGALKLVATRAKVSRGGAASTMHALLGSLTNEGRGVNYVVSKDDLGKGSGPATIVPIHHVPVDKRLTDAGLNDMYPEPDHPTYRFAMAVDLNRCTGCGACETACFAENNIPVVGPDQVRKSRYMGWIRLGRYWQGQGETPDVRFQPNMCGQCSHAPCEGVCPVLATYHNLDGLNAMIYNRCVGTRYCANNCPYTARRFNYHSYKWPESFNLMLSPDVLTREMGVMEKCTFCVQRVRDAKDSYRDRGQTVPDEALHTLPACAQTCPSNAMVFGNLKDPAGKVSKLFQNERAYTMLGELNTKPGLRYLARINHTKSELHHGGGHGDDAGDHGAAAGDHGAAAGEHGAAKNEHH